MPLGKLSKSQIAKGFEVLEEIEALLKTKSPSSAKINELSSKFYTVIPQDFGRQRPPPINDQETLQKKYDMLMVILLFDTLLHLALLEQILNINRFWAILSWLKVCKKMPKKRMRRSR